MIETKKRILFLRADYGTQDLVGGGSVAHTLGVIRGFLHFNYEVLCISSAMHTVLTALQYPGFKLIKLYTPYSFNRLGFKLASLASNLIFYYKINKLLMHERVHLIYQRYSMLSFIGVWLSRKYKLPLVLEFNGSEVWVDENWSHRNVRMKWLLRIVENYNLRCAHKIVVVSQALKDQLVKQGFAADKIEINLNGVDIEAFAPARLYKYRKRVRKELHVEEKFVIGFSGTFGPWHGIDVLAYIIPKIVRNYDRAHFLMMGDGPLKNMLMTTVRENSLYSRVTFLGMLHTDEMPYYLAACDAFICPTQPNKDGSRFFGSPTKLFEYMAMGRPIVASDLEQLAEVLDMPLCKPFLVDPTNKDQFYDAVAGLFDLNVQEHYAIGSVVRQKVEQYTWHAHVERMIKSIEPFM